LWRLRACSGRSFRKGDTAIIWIRFRESFGLSIKFRVLVFLDGEAPLEELEGFFKCGKEVNGRGSRVACFCGFFHEGG
jgi:hypothetical protein